MFSTLGFDFAAASPSLSRQPFCGFGFDETRDFVMQRFTAGAAEEHADLIVRRAMRLMKVRHSQVGLAVVFKAVFRTAPAPFMEI